MIVLLIFFFGLIPCGISIQCFTCNQPGFFCSLPLNIDGGDDSSENDINNPTYDLDYICQSDHYIDNVTGIEKLILRGTKYCQELNAINHRTYCCSSNNCNKWLPIMKRETIISSNNQRYLPSMILIIFSITLQYLFFVKLNRK